MLCKYRINEDREFSSVYFNFANKTVINSEYMLDKSFQEILYRIDNWIDKGFGWVVESIEAGYVNISIYRQLSESTSIELSNKFKHSNKGLINFKNNGSKCFLWCHIRHLNPLKILKE